MMATHTCMSWTANAHFGVAISVPSLCTVQRRNVVRLRVACSTLLWILQV